MRIFSNTIIIMAMSACAIALSGCHEKGCTDRHALNYNVTADVDDGSCIVCKTTYSILDTADVYLTDNYFSSPYYNQKVLKFSLVEQTSDYSDNLCGKGNCTISLVIKSLVNQKMYVNYSLRTFSGPLNIFYSKVQLISSNETVNIGTIETFNSPPYLPLSLDSLYSTTFNSQIIYY